MNSESFRQYFEKMTIPENPGIPLKYTEEDSEDDDINIAYEEIDGDDYDYADEKDLKAAVKFQKHKLVGKKKKNDL